MWARPFQPLPFSAGTHLKEHLGLWHPIVRVGPAQDVRGVQGEGGFLPAVGVGHDAGTTSVQLCLTCHSCHTRGLTCHSCHIRGLTCHSVSHKGAYMSHSCHTRELTCHSVSHKGAYMSQRVTQGGLHVTVCHTSALHVTVCHTRALHVTACHTRGLTCHSVSHKGLTCRRKQSTIWSTDWSQPSRAGRKTLNNKEGTL